MLQVSIYHTHTSQERFLIRKDWTDNELITDDSNKAIPVYSSLHTGAGCHLFRTSTAYGKGKRSHPYTRNVTAAKSALTELLIFLLFITTPQVYAIEDRKYPQDHKHMFSNARTSIQEDDSNKKKKRRTTSSSSSTRPNIVLILADDVGTGDVVGYWGDSGKVAMPHLQNIIDNGVVFNDAHSTPLCAPSRYVVLSGNYQHRGQLYGGTWRANYRQGQFLDKQQSIAQVLRSNDYNTGMAGKWHLVSV